MWQQSTLVWCLWLASPFTQFLVIGAMLRRGLHRDFRWFFTYVLFAATSNLLAVSLFLSHRLDGRFVYCMLIQESGCIILRFGAIYELFVILMRPYPGLKNTAPWVFRFGMGALLLGGVALAASYRWSAGNYHDLIPSIVNVADRTVDVMQCGILLLLLVFSNYLRLSWRDYAFGIAMGLGVYAAIDLSIASILVIAGNWPAARQSAVALELSVLSMSAYLFSILIWLVYALLPERVPKVIAAIPEHELDAWDDELQRLVRR